MARQDGQRVHEVLADPVAAAGLVLESVVVTPAGRRKLVRVTVDLPDDQTGSLDLDRIAEVSRVINTAMDTEEPLGQSPYVLEVSSPGVNRPLTERRHWLRARARLVKVPFEDATLAGRLTEVDDEGVILLIDGEPRRLPWDGLGTGHVQVEFSRQGDSPAGPDAGPDGAPLDEPGLDGAEFDHDAQED